MTPINLANTNIYSGKHISKMLIVRATREGFILVCTCTHRVCNILHIVVQNLLLTVTSRRILILILCVERDVTGSMSAFWNTRVNNSFIYTMLYINSKLSLHARHTSLTINHSKLFQQIMHKNDSAAHTFNQGTRLHIVRDAAPYLGVGGVTICK